MTGDFGYIMPNAAGGNRPDAGDLECLGGSWFVLGGFGHTVPPDSGPSCPWPIMGRWPSAKLGSNGPRTDCS